MVVASQRVQSPATAPAVRAVPVKPKRYLKIKMPSVNASASPLASTHPDGLEWVAAQQGFLNKAQAAPISIIPNYALPGVSHGALATILAGVIGVIIVFGVALSIAYVRRNRQSTVNR